MDFRKIIMLAVVALVVIVAIKMARQEPAVDATTGETAVEGAATTTEPATGEVAPAGEAAPAAETTPATDGAAAPDAVTPATKDTGEASGTEVPAESADEAAPAPAEAH